jgi:hypothetical protein
MKCLLLFSGRLNMMGFVRIQFTEMCTDQLIYVMSIHIFKVTNEKCIHIHIGDSN